MMDFINKTKMFFVEKIKGFDFLAFVKKNKFYSVLVATAFLIGLYFSWTLPESIIFALFISSILKPVDSRFFAVPGLFFLILTPIVLYSGNKKTAEEIAVYAFYFLVMTVMMAFVEMKKEEKGLK